jgi:hypothetical protein
MLTMFEPHRVEVTTSWDAGEEQVIVTKKPFVTFWEDPLSSAYAPEFTPEALGYRRVSHDPSRRVILYARPWLLWAILRLREALRYQFWAFMRANRDIGAIHCKTQAGMCFRWRDIRLGCGKRKTE